MLRREIFDYLHEGEDLVYEPFARLIAERRLATLKYDGFWACMDTFKDRQLLEGLHSRGDAPWEVWRSTDGTYRRVDVGSDRNGEGRYDQSVVAAESHGPT